MAPPVRSNDQCLPRIRWVETGYLKFSAKGTKREVSGMHVPGSLIIADLREASYYQEYLANVVMHRWFLSGEPAKKPNPTAQKVQIHILQYLIHLRMCKDVPTKMFKMFLLVENLRRQTPDNRNSTSETYFIQNLCDFGCKNHGSPLINMNTAFDQVEFRRISLTGFRSCASRSQTEASQSRQSTE
nr:hypothetical protein [Tanacetum cinerariifolium]